jgi:hypothetical protein
VEPLGYWKFDEGSGTTVSDDVGNKNGSFAGGAISWTTDAKSGSALAFTQGNNGVTIPGWSGASFPAVGTVSFWVKTDLPQTEDGGHRNFFDKWSPDPERNHIFVRRINGDTSPLTLSMAFQSGGTTALLLTGGNNVTNQVWHHVAVTWDTVNDVGALYTSDGVIMGNYSSGSFGAKAGGATWTPNEQVFSFGDNVSGIIDEVRLYGVALDFPTLEALSKR